MFSFFSDKNKTGNGIKKTVIFFFIFLFVFGGVFAATTSDASAEAIGSSMIARAFIRAFNELVATLFTIPIQIASLFLDIASTALDFIIEFSITDLKTNFLENNGGVAAVWKTFRDLANMFFIFILLYIAIGTILSLDNVNMKKMLTRVIIVALLINFSLFFTKIMIDASNILTIGIYKQIVAIECGTGTVRDVGGIGAALMCKLGLSDLFGTNSLSSVIGGDGMGATTVSIATFAIMATLLIGITAFVLGAATLMLTARLVVLLFLLMLSPLAFAAMALPSDKYSKKWFDSLINNCILAPAYMAATWAVFMIINKLSPGGDGGLVAAIQGTKTGEASPGMAETFGMFAIIIAMMIGTLIVSKQFGGYGAKGALGALDKTRKWTQGQIGRGALRIGTAQLDKKFADSEFGKSWAGSRLRSVTTGAATSWGFGSGKSIQKVEKEREKVREGMEKDQVKRAEKELDKELREKRREKINKLKGEEKKLEDEIKEIEQLRKAKREGLIPDQEGEDKIATLGSKRAELKQTQDQWKATKLLDDNNSAVTKEETKEWLPEKLEKRVKKLQASIWGDRKKVAKALRKKIVNAGETDFKKLMDDAVAAGGQANPPPPPR